LSLPHTPLQSFQRSQLGFFLGGEWRGKGEGREGKQKKKIGKQMRRGDFLLPPQSCNPGYIPVYKSDGLVIM